MRDCEKSPAVLEALEQMGIEVKRVGADSQDVIIMGGLAVGGGVIGAGVAAAEMVAFQIGGRLVAGAVIGGVVAGIIVSVASAGYLGFQSSWTRKQATEEISAAMKLEMRSR